VNKILQIWHMVEQRLKRTRQLQTTGQNPILRAVTPLPSPPYDTQRRFDFLEVQFLERGRLRRRKLPVCVYFRVALQGVRKIIGRAGGDGPWRDGRWGFCISA